MEHGKTYKQGKMSCLCDVGRMRLFSTESNFVSHSIRALVRCPLAVEWLSMVFLKKKWVNTGTKIFKNIISNFISTSCEMTLEQGFMIKKSINVQNTNTNR